MPTLLLADDSITIQRVIELTFAGEDIDVLTTGDGDEAVARIQQDRPDIVLADIAMPKRTGYEVAEFVKGHADLAHIPVLLLAGAFEPVDQDRAAQVRCDGVLVKPFEPYQVVTRVRELLAGAPGSPQHSVAGVPRPVERLISSNVRDGQGGGPASARPPAFGEGMHSDGRVPIPTAADAPVVAQAPVGAPVAVPQGGLSEVEPDVPTLQSVLGLPHTASPIAPTTSDPLPEIPDSWPHRQAGLTGDPAPDEDGTRTERARDALAEAFNALLAAERGEATAPVHLVAPFAEPQITDELVDAVARRVVERLAPDMVREVVVEVVAEVAERLIREEIARIRERR